MHNFSRCTVLVGHSGDKKERLHVDEIMTPSEVAALLKIHVKTVYKLAEKGVLPGNRIGRSWRFSKGDILKLVSDKQKQDSRIVRRSSTVKGFPKDRVS